MAVRQALQFCDPFFQIVCPKSERFDAYANVLFEERQAVDVVYCLRRELRSAESDY